MNKIFLLLIVFFLSQIQGAKQQLFGMELDGTQKEIAYFVNQIKSTSIDLSRAPSEQEEFLEHISIHMKGLSALTKSPYKYLASPIPNPTQITFSLYGFFHQLYYLGGNYCAYTFKNGNFAIFNAELKMFSTIASGHTDIINAAIMLHNGNIATASKDRSIKIWCRLSGACLHTLTGHRHQVRSVIEFASGLIASASWDRTIKIWNPETGKCLKTLKNHSGFINTLFLLKNGNFISVADDNTLNVWDSATFECLCSIKEMGGWIHSLIELRNGNIAFATGDHLIKIYNLETEDLVQTFIGHNHAISQLIELRNEKIVSTSSRGCIKSWNPETGLCEQTIMGCDQDWITSLIELNYGELIATATKNGSIKIHSLKTGDNRSLLFGHKGHIYRIWQLENGNLISSSDDVPIVLWDLYPESLRSLFNKSHAETIQNIALLIQLQKHSSEEYALTTEYSWEHATHQIYDAYGYTPPPAHMITLYLNTSE